MIEFININTIEMVDTDRFVNDLTVCDEHNYVANDYVVHNCLSSSNTGIHNGIVNLINDTYKLKKEVEREMDIPGNSYRCLTNIIADGGIRNYDDVIKALALGADYVMIGGVLASLLESSASTFFISKFDNKEVYIDQLSESIKEHDGLFDIVNVDANGDELCSYGAVRLKKSFYGMASKKGQIDLFGKKKRTSEGKEVILDCKSTIGKWSENMNDYLASTMSYCDIRDVRDLNPENVETRLLSPAEQNAINK